MINRSKTNKFCAYNTAVIEETLEKGGSWKPTRKKLAIGKDKMYEFRNEQGAIAHSMDEVIKIDEQFYTRLYASDIEPGVTTEPTSLAGDVRGSIKRA